MDLYTSEVTFGRITLWRVLAVRPSVGLSVCPSVYPALAKFCPLINFKLISPRLICLCTMNGHDPQMSPIDFEVNISNVKVSVTLNINHCPLNSLKSIKLRNTIVCVLVGHFPYTRITPND